MWLVNPMVPIDGRIKQIICVVLWLLGVFGLWQVANIRVPQVR